MRLRSLSGLCLASLCVSALLAPGCGSSDNKKNVPRYSGGGEGGAGVGEAGSGGSGATAGSAGSSGDAGSGTGGDAGAGNNVGGDAGMGAVGPIGGASDGGAGGEGPVAPFHGLYVGEDGDDTAEGTVDAPFETLAHAASVAQPGDTIVFLDGSYAVGNVAVIPAGVNLMAHNSGAATLTGNGTLLNLSGDIRIEGLKFQSYNRVAYFGAGATATGTVTLVDTTFVNCAIGLELSGTSSAVVDVADSFVVGNGGNAFVTLVDEASLDMTGGILQNYGNGGIIRARYDSTVSMTGVQVLDGTGTVLTLMEDAVAELSDVTFATLGQALIEQRNSTELTISDSDLSIKPAAANNYYVVSNVGLTAGSSLTITDSSLHGVQTALRGGVWETMTITNVEFSDLSFGGMDLGSGDGTVRITGSTFDVQGNVALRIGQGGDLNDIKIRDTTFNCTSPANWNCVTLDGGNASTVDLGTVSDPGGNTFLQSGLNQSTALRLGYQAINTTAVGNTWTPNEQGADDQGKYTAPDGSGNTLVVPKTTVMGRNYQMPYGGTLLLAENP